MLMGNGLMNTGSLRRISAKCLRKMDGVLEPVPFTQAWEKFRTNRFPMRSSEACSSLARDCSVLSEPSL